MAKKYHNKRCWVCHDKFQSVRSDARFCSPRCRQWNHRNKDETIQWAMDELAKRLTEEDLQNRDIAAEILEDASHVLTDLIMQFVDMRDGD